MLVTGYVDLGSIEFRARTNEHYLDLGRRLLSLPIKKVAFLPSNMLETLDVDSTNNTYVNFESSDLENFNDIGRSEITYPSPNSLKDTKYYLAVQNQKTDFVRRAIQLFPDEKFFVWIDFGIFHLSKDDVTFAKAILNMYEKVKAGVGIKGTIRLPGCRDPRVLHGYGKTMRDIIFSNGPIWMFCGGLFAGDREALIKFDESSKLYNKYCLSLNRVTFEINIWLLIYLENPELFNWYYGDHNLSMIENF